MRRFLNPYHFFGFALSAVSALTQRWSLSEFCWSTWLAVLVYAWLCILTATLQIFARARAHKRAIEERLPFLRKWPTAVFNLAITAMSGAAGLAGFHLSNYIFSFYGMFLSVFSEMEPLSLFGRNGFINSDFYTPVHHLLNRFWPMVLGVVIANWPDFLLDRPWKRIFLPLHSELLRMHAMVLALPFLSLIAWAFFKDNYQPITVVLLMGVLYFLPRKTGSADAPGPH